MRRRIALLALSAVVMPLAAAACGSSAPAKTTATFAEEPGLPPNYILPLAGAANFTAPNVSQFQPLLYRPLYWFGSNGRVAVDNDVSLANPPQYASDGKSVTVTLKHFEWSDGQLVTARDVEFWQNLVTANKLNWGGYSPGEYPDNITGTTVNSPTSITFKLSQAYGPTFFTYNELSQITPLPQHVWDKESATGSVADYDRTPAGAVAVYNFLNAQSSDLTSYNTNTLWRVVDGPWKMKSLDKTGLLKLVPNARYSGPSKPKLTEFDEIPFSNEAAEFAALKQGPGSKNGVDYGYVPYSQAGQKNAVTGIGYNVVPWVGWQINYVQVNFTNPKSGPMFNQPYFRQALQQLIDQNSDINNAMSGYGYPTYGPVPLKPGNDFLDTSQQHNLYPFNTQAAAALLRANGWTVNSGGVSTCANAGSSAGQCGGGIPAGAQASFKLEYSAGESALDKEMQTLKRDFATAGVQVELSTAPFNTVLEHATPCTTDQACTWDMQFWGGGWIYAPDYYPSGDEIFSTGAAANYGGYTDAQMDTLITSTETSATSSSLQPYQDYAAKQLPVLWMPTAYPQLSAISGKLQGADPQNPLLSISPEKWSFSS
ncbi:MAG: ABC transporter substrate-binding protein [Candidatus Dormibacteraeota bacterium]|nr:ABC transporter substrate-binding protein [Candidatus Dormibacteraeota bacterium]